LRSLETNPDPSVESSLLLVVVLGVDWEESDLVVCELSADLANTVKSWINPRLKRRMSQWEWGRGREEREKQCDRLAVQK
jgi:hypothetical protein